MNNSAIITEKCRHAKAQTNPGEVYRAMSGGDWYTAEDLATLTDMKISSIRPALSELRAEGWIEYKPGRISRGTPRPYRVIGRRKRLAVPQPDLITFTSRPGSKRSKKIERTVPELIGEVYQLLAKIDERSAAQCLVTCGTDELMAELSKRVNGENK